MAKKILIADDSASMRQLITYTFDLQTRTSAPTYGQGIGLLGMGERLRLLGGRLDIESRPGGGTRLAAHVPWKEAA